MSEATSTERGIAIGNTETLDSEIAPVILSADSLVVRNVTEHQRGLEMLGAVMGAERKVKAFFAPSVEAAMEAKRKAEETRKEIVAMQDRFLRPVMEARTTISQKCAAFEAEERRAAEETRKAMEREAIAKQDEQREIDAAMADTPEAAEDALTEPLEAPAVPTVKPLVAKVAGVSTRETWAAEVTDKAAFLAWAAKPENNYYAQPNEVALNSRARAEHEKMQIPGVKAVASLSHSRR